MLSKIIERVKRITKQNNLIILDINIGLLFLLKKNIGVIIETMALGNKERDRNFTKTDAGIQSCPNNKTIIYSENRNKIILPINIINAKKTLIYFTKNSFSTKLFSVDLFALK
jgi:hypothetical protein